MDYDSKHLMHFPAPIFFFFLSFRHQVLIDGNIIMQSVELTTDAVEVLKGIFSMYDNDNVSP